MRPRPGGILVSHRMDDHPSGPFEVPSLDLDPIDKISPQPSHIAEPRTSPTLAPRSRSARRRRGLWLLLLALLAAGGLALFAWPTDRGPSPSQTGRSQPSGPMPVATAPVATADVPVVLNALGTVTPLATVTVRPQISGQ